jgi:hypothetical protein
MHVHIFSPESSCLGQLRLVGDRDRVDLDEAPGMGDGVHVDEGVGRLVIPEERPASPRSRRADDVDDTPSLAGGDSSLGRLRTQPVKEAKRRGAELVGA